MLAWLLNAAYLSLLIAVSPWIAFQSLVRGKYRRGLVQKIFGAVPRRGGNRPCIWIHAVSVGEVLQLQPVIEGLLRDRPDVEIVLSTTTSTGYDVAVASYSRCHVCFFPLDFSWAVARAFERIRPTLVVLVELELWPNFLFTAAARHVPVVLINGRIGEKSFRGYRRIRPLAAAMFRCIRRLAVQNETYASRLIELGADRSRVQVTGSIKFDRVETDRGNAHTTQLRRAFSLSDDEQVFVAGSTHAPEERYALDAWLAARGQFPDLRLILVPRHKERFEEVARIVEREYRLPLLRRSHVFSCENTMATSSCNPGDTGVATSFSRAVRAKLSEASLGSPLGGEGGTPGEQSNPDFRSRIAELDLPPVLLLDTLGELSACWGLADIAFVGGSLTRRGGQNMIEPAGYGAAVLFGPNTWNFKDVVDLLLAGDAASVVGDSAGLAKRVCELAASPDSGLGMGRRAKNLVARQRGATDRTVELIRATLVEAECQPPCGSGAIRAA